VIVCLQIVFWISLSLVVYSYLLYPGLLPLLARIFGRPTKMDDHFYPSVAVIVPVYNEEKVIRVKIDNLLALDYPADRYTIRIGSDCSTDATHDIVRSFNNGRVGLWIAQRRGGKTEVINHLVPLIDTDIILFTDANTMHRPDSLKKLVRSFADPTVGGVAGSIKHRASKEEREERLYRSFESLQKYFESRLHSSISAFGGFYSIRTSLFRPIHYNAYSNDDVLIPMNLIRRGYRVVFDPEALSEEDMTESIAQEFSRRIRIGAGNFQAFFWLLDFLNPLRGWPWFCYLSHKVARWFSPFFLGSAFICGAVLWLLTSQAVFSIVPLLGILFLTVGLSFFVVPGRINRTAFYFLTMNAALALGLVRYCKGIQSAAWTRTERETERTGNK
jgi:cellulose synthase/poly-beta-1,6-N-acetylglucosamine synthase-like glycosyltransferase